VRILRSNNYHCYMELQHLKNAQYSYMDIEYGQCLAEAVLACHLLAGGWSLKETKALLKGRPGSSLLADH